MKDKDLIKEKVKEEKKVVDAKDLKDFEEKVKEMEKKIQEKIDEMTK